MPHGRVRLDEPALAVLGNDIGICSNSVGGFVLGCEDDVRNSQRRGLSGIEEPCKNESVSTHLQGVDSRLLTQGALGQRRQKVCRSLKPPLSPGPKLGAVRQYKRV